MKALPVLTAVSEQTEAVAHLDAEDTKHHEDKDSQGAKEAEGVKKITDHQQPMINPFTCEEGSRFKVQGSTLLSPWGNLSWAQCIIAYLTYTEYKRTKNTTTDTNTTRQINILTSRTCWSLIDLNCPLLYNIEIYSMGIKCKCLLH